MNALVIGADERAALEDLRERAAGKPVNMPELMAVLKLPDGKRRHMAQMNAQTVRIPMDYFVTFSIEIGHPVGTCRHMSMSSGRTGHVPIPEGVWIVCEVLGFQGSLKDCRVWLEDLNGGPEKAVNVVQPIAVAEPAQA